MDWGSVIANAVGGAASGMVSVADAQQKEDSRRELETLKGQLQMDRLQASIEAKFQNLITGIEGKLAVQDAKNNARDGSSGGGKPKGLLDLDPEKLQLAERIFGIELSPTDRNRFIAATKNGDPLTARSPEEEQAAIESGGDVGDALSRKMTGLASEAFDEKGYSKAEGKRRAQAERLQVLLTNPGALENLSKSNTDDFIRQVATFALENPKATVGELADRLSLLKPGDKRIAADKDGNLYNESTGERVGERRTDAPNETKREIDILRERRVQLDQSENNILALQTQELKDPLLSQEEKAEIRGRYKSRLQEIAREKDELKGEMKSLQSRLSSKPAATAGNKTGTTGTTGTTKSPTLTRAERDRLIGTIKSMQ